MATVQIHNQSNAALHLSAFLLRLLDEHRPAHPLPFIQAVLRRTGGGMRLPPPMLLEFLQVEASGRSTTMLVNTLRFSMDAWLPDTRDPTWRRITFGAAPLLRELVDKPETSFATMYRTGAPWGFLFAHRVATSMNALQSAVSNGNLQELRVVVELQGEDPSSPFLFYQSSRNKDGDAPSCSSSDASAMCGENLLEAIHEELEQLLMAVHGGRSPSSSSFRCAVVFVVQSLALHMQNPQSRSSLLVRLIEEKLMQQQQQQQAKSSSGSSSPPLPPISFRVEAVDEAVYEFPAIAVACRDMTTTISGSPTEPNVKCLWLRDPRRHTELILQCGHLIQQFGNAASKPFEGEDEGAASSSSKAPAATSAAVALLDLDAQHYLDTAAVLAHMDQQRPEDGLNVGRCVLTAIEQTDADRLTAHLLRESLGLSFGNTTWCLGSDAILLSSSNSGRVLLSRLATMKRESSLRSLNYGSRVLFNAKLIAAAARFSSDSSSGPSIAVGRAAPVLSVGQGLLRLRVTAPEPIQCHVEALQAAVALQAADLVASSAAAVDGGDSTTSAAAASIDSEVLPEQWLAALRLLTVENFLQLLRGNPVCNSLKLVQRAGCLVESEMRRVLPVKGTLSAFVRAFVELPPPAATSSTAGDDDLTNNNTLPIRLPGVVSAVQSLTPKYLHDALAGTLPTPRTVVAEAKAAAAAAAATAAASSSAPAAAPSPKKKK